MGKSRSQAVLDATIKRVRILLLNQAFYPDVVSSGQHLTDLAVSLSQAGPDVTAVAASSGYDDANRRFRYHENWKGIDIIRIRDICR